MRVIVIAPNRISNGAGIRLKPCQVADIPDELAAEWIKARLVIADRTMAGDPEAFEPSRPGELLQGAVGEPEIEDESDHGSAGDTG